MEGLSSMTNEADEPATSENSKRIYGTITDAWFEYECEEKSNCSILRVPEIK